MSTKKTTTRVVSQWYQSNQLPFQRLHVGETVARLLSKLFYHIQCKHATWESGRASSLFTTYKAQKFVCRPFNENKWENPCTSEKMLLFISHTFMFMVIHFSVALSIRYVCIGDVYTIEWKYIRLAFRFI